MRYKLFIRKHFWKILAYVAVFVVSVVPVPEVKPLESVPLMDKWVHFVMYGGLALAGWLDTARMVRKKRADLCVEGARCQVRFGLHSVFTFPVLFGGLMELVQAYATTCRSGEWMDFLADTVGVVLAFPIGLWLIRRYLSKGSKAGS